MTPAEIHERVKAHFGEQVLEFNGEVLNPFLKLAPEILADIARYLRDDPALHFNYLMCLSGVDYGPGQNLGVVYHLQSMTLMHQIVLKVDLPRESPAVPSVALIWRTADWHEREAYDLFGIRFEGHPDLRRIFLPDDWEGHPLRKDYVVQEFYHDIRVPFPDLDPDRGTYIFVPPAGEKES
ncbi:MAG: NADH-quinone oxidoreductase subunit C [Nitrospinae bacterium]|nr:NADH-quinone oxidoreductase subunit C [Nitrospinota bacterium]